MNLNGFLGKWFSHVIFALKQRNVEMKQEGDMNFICNILSAYVQKKDSTDNKEKPKNVLSRDAISRGILNLHVDGKYVGVLTLNFLQAHI